MTTIAARRSSALPSYAMSVTVLKPIAEKQEDFVKMAVEFLNLFPEPFRGNQQEDANEFFSQIFRNC